MKKETCRQMRDGVACGAPIDLAVDKTVCGYGKCEKCCGGCLHRTYLNSQSPAGRARIELLDNMGREYLVA